MKFTVVLPPLEDNDGGIALVGNVEAWRKRDGEAVSVGDVLAIVSGQEVLSPVYGVLHRRLVFKNEAIEPGEPLAVLSGVPDSLVTGPVSRPDPLQLPVRPISPPPNAETAPLSPQQVALARHHARSWQTAPQSVAVTRVDVSEAVRLGAKTQTPYAAMVVAVVASVLGRFPNLNAFLAGEATLYRHRSVHIAVESANPEAHPTLPVITDANRKSVRAIARELAAPDIRPRDPATFTIWLANAGVLWQTTPLRQPRTGLLCVGPPTLEAVATGTGTVEVRTTGHLCLVHDSRIVRENEAANFLAEVKAGLENTGFLFSGGI